MVKNRKGTYVHKPKRGKGLKGALIGGAIGLAGGAFAGRHKGKKDFKKDLTKVIGKRTAHRNLARRGTKSFINPNTDYEKALMKAREKGHFPRRRKKA